MGDSPIFLRPAAAPRQPCRPASVSPRQPSARRNQLLVRDYEQPLGRDVELDWEALPTLPHERRIQRLAHWVESAEREGLRYRLRLPGHPVLGPANGPAHRHLCLRALALLPHETH